MAKQRLEPDYIQWVVKLDGSQTQQELKRLKGTGDDLNKTLKEQQSRMQTLQAEGKKNSAEYKQLEKDYKATTQAIRLNNLAIKECESHLNLSDKTAAQLSKELRTLQRELRNTSKNANPEEYRRLQEQIAKVEKAYRAATTETKSFWQRLKDLDKGVELVKGGLWSLANQALNSVRQAFSGALQTITDFEHAQSVLASVTGSTKEGVKELTLQAKELGATTAFSASQVTELQTALARLGFVQESIKAMTPEVLKFAQAVGTDLESAASMSGAALRMFGLDAEDTGRVVSTLAIGTTKSALSFEYLQTALVTAGPTAAAFGFTIEETTALLGQLANSGFDASSAGTAVRNLLLNMADPAGKLAVALGKPVSNLEDLSDGLKRLESEGIDLAEALELTDKRSVGAFETFLKGADALKELRDGVTGADDDFNKMVDTMGSDLSGRMKELQSATEGLILAFSGVTGPISSFVGMLATALGYITKLISGESQWSKLLGSVLSAVVLLTAAITAKVVATRLHITAIIADTAAQMKNIGAQVAARTASIAHTAALVAQNIAAGNLTRALKILRIALLSNPFTAAAVAVAALGVAIYQLTQRTKELTVAEKTEQELAKTIKEREEERLSNINRLTKAINDENTSIDEKNRLLAILKKETGENNLKLGENNRLTRDSVEAINRRCQAIRKEIAIEAYREKLLDLQKKKIEAEEEKEKEEKNAGNAAQMASDNAGNASNLGWTLVSLFSGNKAKQATNKIAEIDAAMAKLEEGITKFELSLSDLNDTSTNAASKSLIKKLEEEKAKVKEWDESTEAAITKKNRELERIDKEIQRLQKLGKEDKNNGGYGEKGETDKVLKPLENEHKQRMLMIEKNGREEGMKQVDITLKQTAELMSYYQKRIDALKALEAKTPADKKKLLDEIHALTIEAEQKIYDAQAQNEDALVKRAQQSRAERIEIENAYYNQQKQTLSLALKEGKITQGAHNAYMTEVEQEHLRELAEIARTYQENVAQIDIHGNEKREQLQKDANDAVRKADNDLIIARANAMEKLRQMEQAAPIGLAGMQEQRDRMIADTEATYDAVIKIAREAGLSTVELERQKQAEINQINYEYQQRQPL